MSSEKSRTDAQAARTGSIVTFKPSRSSLLTQKRTLGMHCRVCRVDECGAEPLIACARLPAHALSGTFVIAGTHARPRREMRRTRKAGHIRPDFHQNN